MDIQTKLAKIYETGLTDQAIGDEIGASQSVVTRLRTGKHRSTGYERGLKIDALYKTRCRDQAEAVPAEQQS